MKRLSGIMQAKANKVLDKAEDPRDTLDLSYEKQMEQLQKLRRSVADVATARKRIELQATQLQTSAAKLQDQARQALSQNREDLAKEALTRRAAIATQLASLETQHQQIKAQEDKLVATTQRIQTQVESFRTQKETMKASYTAAQAQTKIGETVSGISEEMGDSSLALQRAQDKIEQMQARAGAIDELTSSGALEDMSQTSDSLQAELDKVASSSQVDSDLAQLKSELGMSETPTGVIGAGAETTGAAQPPPSQADIDAQLSQLEQPGGAPS
ncbi:MAG: PspA/IM30 family protein [Actinobacteria bacterium]|jgi:phage shock protein A|nr:PspA/IM30 family protein [Actinomycetota bacterium]